MKGKKNPIVKCICTPPFLADTNTFYLTLHDVDSLLTENCYICPMRIVYTYCLICFHLLGTVGGGLRPQGQTTREMLTLQGKPPRAGGSRLHAQAQGGSQCDRGVLQLALEPPKFPKFCSSPALCWVQTQVPRHNSEN